MSKQEDAEAGQARHSLVPAGANAA